MSGLEIWLNVQTGDIESAREVTDRYPGRVVVGVPTKGFADLAEAVDLVNQMQESGVMVSAGLGDGSADQWARAHALAMQTHPFHLNQVFPAAGFSAGALGAVGARTIVNALIRPGERAGFVRIGTGPQSEALDQPSVSAELAVSMLTEIGLTSVKFFPMQGLERLDHYAAVAAVAGAKGMTMEATGGLTPENLGDVLEVSRRAGVRSLMPHLYSSVKVPGTDLLDFDRVEDAMAVISRYHEAG